MRSALILDMVLKSIIETTQDQHSKVPSSHCGFLAQLSLCAYEGVIC